MYIVYIMCVCIYGIVYLFIYPLINNIRLYLASQYMYVNNRAIYILWVGLAQLCTFIPNKFQICSGKLC